LLLQIIPGMIVSLSGDVDDTLCLIAAFGDFYWLRILELIMIYRMFSTLIGAWVA